MSVSPSDLDSRLSHHKLLYEFVMTPDVFDASNAPGDRELRGTLEELLQGMCDNGLVASLDKGRWRQHVLVRVDNLPKDRHRDRVIRLLSTLSDRRRIVRHPKRTAGPPASDSDWLETALEAHRLVPFYGIILTKRLLVQCDLDDPTFMELSRAMDSSRWENRGRSVTLTQSEADYRAVLGPLLRHARVLDIVDPYMNCREPRFFTTVRLCAELMGQRGQDRLEGLIRIHAGDPAVVGSRHHQELAATRLDEWERQLQPLVGRHHRTFEIFLWAKRLGGQPFHDRYLLTDQCGVSAPGGLDCPGGSEANRTTWVLLDDDDRRRHLKELNPPDRVTGPFGLVGHRKIGMGMEQQLDRKRR